MMRTACYLGFAAIVFSAAAHGSDLDNAPPSFEVTGGRAVPVDFLQVDGRYEFRSGDKAYGDYTIEFVSAEDGFPIFDMVPSITSITLDGESIATNTVDTIADPTGVTRFRILKKKVTAGQTYLMRIQFSSSSIATFEGDTVRAGFFMSDLASGGREFWEQYGPSNLEFDHFPLNLSVSVTGTNKEHEVFTNGALAEVGGGRWNIAFPDYFTTSSFYFHLADKGRFDVKEGTFAGMNGDIPVVVYSTSASRSQDGYASSLRIMAELESVYGAFAHRKLVVYVTPDGGGMEHCGATMTSMWALGHELTHSWFARGVMPADGNAGWIDEAIASWRDDGYIRRSQLPSSPRNLGGFSDYRRETTMSAYSYGESMMRYFDHQFRDVEASGEVGLKAVLNLLFERYARRSLTVTSFQEFLEEVTGHDLQDTFDRYVRNSGKALTVSAPEFLRVPTQIWQKSHHPRPYTKQERIDLR